jgi:hypothetical protein
LHIQFALRFLYLQFSYEKGIKNIKKVRPSACSSVDINADFPDLLWSQQNIYITTYHPTEISRLSYTEEAKQSIYISMSADITALSDMEEKVETPHSDVENIRGVPRHTT